MRSVPSSYGGAPQGLLVPSTETRMKPVLQRPPAFASPHFHAWLCPGRPGNEDYTETSCRRKAEAAFRLDPDTAGTCRDFPNARPLSSLKRHPLPLGHGLATPQVRSIWFRSRLYSREYRITTHKDMGIRGRPFLRKEIVRSCVAILLTDFVSSYIDTLTALRGAFQWQGPRKNVRNTVEIPFYRVSGWKRWAFHLEIILNTMRKRKRKGCSAQDIP